MKTYRNQKAVIETNKISKEILENKRSNHHRDKFFPELINRMNLKTAAEIGVDKGGFSHHLVSKTKLNKLYCIDCWMDDFGSDHRPNEYDKIGNNRMQEAKDLLYDYSDRVIFIKSMSVEAAKNVEDGELDFCYIDGDHSLQGIFNDIYTWINKVKKGGILAGHDYKDGPKSGIKDFWGDQLPYKIETVVVNFCQQYGFKLNVVGGRIKSWWFVK